MKELDDIIAKHPTPFDFEALKTVYVSAAARPQPSFEQLVEVFRVNDPRRSGLIPLGEMHRMLTHLGDKLDDDEWALIAKELEVSRDGDIDYEVAVQTMLR